MAPSEQEKIRIDWLEYISNENLRLAIPVGCRFQADLPPSNGASDDDINSDCTKWLGTKVWPSDEGRINRETDAGNLIGKGRPNEICQCSCPGSIQCVKRHTTAKKLKLQSDLGSAFWKWEFDNMGENVSESWSLEEQKKFENIVKLNANSYGQILINSALEYLPSRSRKDIVSYYLNVHIQRRMSKQIRLGCSSVDTDDETEKTPSNKSSRKKLEAYPVALNDRMSQYLIGKR
ncbi:hypothetical protein M9H77_05997 [Catharanthus roseus]|uniref:Uncharacterized protein n=1 Tax=Catharanthus roseus TaxID=4058 RepID=A0ACC0BR27_CATRO|nr:hypothetical protein M9H77_05997 [Catharanthus roseus]